MSRSARIAVLLACAMAVYAIGVFARWGVLDVQAARHGKIPFTLESALSFHYAALASGQGIPAQDLRTSAPDGLLPRESFHLGASVLAAKAYGLLRWVSDISLEDFLRKITAPVFCLGALAMFACVRVAAGGLLLPVLASLAYALAIPALMRSTGQEWMCENIALPFLWMHFLLLMMGIVSLRAPGLRLAPISNFCSADPRYSFSRFEEREKASVSAVAKILMGPACSRQVALRDTIPTLQVLLSALTLAFSWILWDMVQVYVLLLGMVSMLLLWKRRGEAPVRAYATLYAAALFGIALLDPYLRAHGAWASHAVGVWMLFALLCHCRSFRAWIQAALVMLFVAAFSVLHAAAQDSYQHFLALLFYKLKFVNIKPENPALLPYAVRALWVPALHSSSLDRLAEFWGPACWVWLASLIAGTILWMRSKLDLSAKVVLLLSFAFGFLSVLFVRMEVFFAFFGLLAIAMLFSYRGWLRKIGYVALAGMVGFWTLQLPVKATTIGRDVDYSALGDIVSWASEHTAPQDIILASYSLSPSFAAYAQRPIALQPKYESLRFRQKIERFEHALMAKKESAFYSLCKTWGVRYYIHSKGFYADHSVNSFRYLVGDLQPSNETNLFKFEINPRFLNNFRLVYQNDKYLVYRVVDFNDLEKSRFCVEKGRTCLSEGLPARALRWCNRALNLFPGRHEARVLAIRSYGAQGDSARARQETSWLFERMQVQRLREM